MNVTQIKRAIERELKRLRPLVEEHGRLVQAAAALQDLGGPTPVEAPYGLKADGTPRKRPAPSAESQARGIATRRRKARANEVMHRMRKPEGLRLNVQTVTGPTEREMEDREVRHVTQEPA